MTIFPLSAIIGCMGIQSDSILRQAYKLIESCQIEQAKNMLEDALKGDLNNKALVFAIYCSQFWLSPFSSQEQGGCFEQGESLIADWKLFKKLLQKKEFSVDGADYENIVYSFKKGIFSAALEKYGKSPDENDSRMRAEICRKKGLCYKKLGSYETALSCLTEANETLGGQAAVLAEMADCYALCGETKYAKLLFREAFFTDAQRIDLDFLDAPLITVLVEQVEQKGYAGAEKLEWIPVYGVLLGVFGVKRELRSQEVLRLKQDIYSLESELKDPANNSAVLTPRLMNLYFWLIDHYVLSKDSVAKINEVLLKIKILDPAVYQMYVK